jgi:hypothetical protein
VRIDPGVPTGVRHLVLKVCSTTGCADVAVEVLRGPDGSRSGVASMDHLRAGPLTVTGTYRVRGRDVRLAGTPVRATTNYPNGRDCGADGASARIAVGTDRIRAA